MDKTKLFLKDKDRIVVNWNEYFAVSHDSEEIERVNKILLDNKIFSLDCKGCWEIYDDAHQFSLNPRVFYLVYFTNKDDAIQYASRMYAGFDRWSLRYISEVISKKEALFLKQNS